MQPNHVIGSKKELLNHFGSSQKLEIRNLQQMEDLLKMNIPAKVWKDASNRNQLSFNQEFLQQTNEFTFIFLNIKYINLISFFTNLTELDLSENQISDISSISKLKGLKILQLNKNCIKDISALLSLSDLIYLVELNLSENQISDISSISKLKNLQKLYLQCNNIEDISSIQFLIQHIWIYLKINQLPTQQLCRIQLNYYSILTTSCKTNLGCNILLNYRDQVYLKQKLQIQTIFLISYSA
ncbi:leucine-rich_repeat domain-containing protein [Hexamita inflata]|uniref:Partial n=1 Tax=Hexamita inflata TaxID=28002 RepID=A0AA86TKC4_9EUKA|nr:leucine-rich repeat domain-containing protein [Hexamita inflata]